MLIREPCHRASLNEIIQHPWVQQGTTPLVPYSAPLVTALPLTSEEHHVIVDKMESGNLACREEILRYLKNIIVISFFHIFSVFLCLFLLAFLFCVFLLFVYLLIYLFHSSVSLFYHFFYYLISAIVFSFHHHSAKLM